MTNLDVFWENIFSQDAARVRLALRRLNDDERAATIDVMRNIAGDDERINAQRIAAQFALGVQAHMQPAPLPEGALDFARAFAHDTAQFLLSSFGEGAADTKRDGTLVTQFDLESDRRLSEAILSRYPTHRVLSEERDRTYRGQEWCWVIDPIDGTTNYTWGYPCWGVLIGLLHDGYPVMGVADFPHTREQFYAVLGEGAWMNGSRLHTLQLESDAQGRPQFAPTHLFACCTRTLKNGNPNVPMKVRLPGSTGYNFALVAKGACAGSLDVRAHVWDVAALWPIAEMAGAALKTTQPLFPLRKDTDYADVSFGVLAGCSPAAADALAEMLDDRFAASAIAIHS
jgi:myo-inositol-1(or 4)-monophosphatase